MMQDAGYLIYDIFCIRLLAVCIAVNLTDVHQYITRLISVKLLALPGQVVEERSGVKTWAQV
jgi:hypothetical protein